MFCKECGAEIPDDSKHCKECGANLIEDSSSDAQENKEKKKSNKKWIIGCCIGLIIIFGIIAFMLNSSDVDSHVYTGLYKALSDDGYDIGLHDRDSDHKQLNVINKEKNIKILVNLSTSSDYFDELYKEGVNNEIQINNITAYEMTKDGMYYLIYKDNNNTLSFCTEEANSEIVKQYVRDY